MFYNEDMFANPEVYDPERFVKNPENVKVADLIFGTGRVSSWRIHWCLDVVTYVLRRSSVLVLECTWRRTPSYVPIVSMASHSRS